MKYILLSILIFMIFLSCGDKKQYNENEMKEYSKKGQEIVSETFDVLAKHLMTSIKTGGIGYAIGFCNEEAQKIMDSVSKSKGVQIRRTSLKERNPIDQPDQNEVEALNVIQQSISSGKGLHPILKKLDEKTIAYYHPIVIDNPVCLNCHGKPGVDIDSVVLRTLKDFYPNDRATGYKIGDLRGMWSIKFNLEKK